MNTIAAQAGVIEPGSIVVGVAEKPSEEALDWALIEASITGRPIVLVHAITPLTTQQRVSLRKMGVSPDSLVEEARGVAKIHLDGVVDEMGPRAVGVQTVVVEGEPAEVLTTVSQDAYRLVVGSRGRGTVTSRLLGSVGSRVVREATCPAVVVRPWPGGDTKRRIVASASTSAEGQAALEAAFEEAQGRRCALTLVAHDPAGIPASGHWGVTSDERRRDEIRLGLAEAVAGLEQDHPDVIVSTCVADGSLLHALIDIGEHAELIVIERPGTDGRRGVFGLPSSLAASVVEHASTPVLVVP